MYYFTLKRNKNKLELDFQHIPLKNNKYLKKFKSKAKAEHEILTHVYKHPLLIKNKKKSVISCKESIKKIIFEEEMEQEFEEKEIINFD